MIARVLLAVLAASSPLAACDKSAPPTPPPRLSAQPAPPSSEAPVKTENVEPDRGQQQPAPALTQEERERLIRRTEIADPKSEPGK